MFIEKWKDTAFGSDFGGDFQRFLEQIPIDKLTLADIYERCDLKKYFDQPDILNERMDNNVKLDNPNFEQFVHYEDAVIALTAIVVECELNGSADLSKAYGSKTLAFEITKEELVTLKKALSDIHDNPHKFVLFEMLNEGGRNETLVDIAEIIEQLKTALIKNLDTDTKNKIMGAWDYGIFDDDTAYDFTEEIKKNPKEFFKTSFNNAIASDYLEYDDCHAVTVSAAYLDNLLNGTNYRTDSDEEEDESNVNNFGKLHRDLQVDELKPLAVKSLKIVISTNSELNELWSENEDLYPKWKQNIEELIERLK